MKRALALAALALLGCDKILGIQERHFDPGGGACATAFDCGPGNFCQSGACTAAPPANASCKLLEPNDVATLAGIDFGKRPLVLGTLFRMQNQGELPRLAAMRLAAREVNQSGGVAGRNLVMVACDYGGPSGTDAGAQAAPAIKNGVDYLGAALGAGVIVSGSSSSATQVAIDRILAQRYPVALVSSFSTSTQLTNYADKLAQTDPYGLLWRTAPDDAAQADVLARLIAAQKGLTKLAIVYIDDAYGLPLQQGIKTGLVALGSSLATELHPFDAGDDQAKFTKLMNDMFASMSPPDALLFIGIDGTQVVTAYKALVDSGHAAAFKAQFLADAAKDAATLLDPKLSAAVRAVVATARGTAPYHSTAPHYDTFATQLKKEFDYQANDFSFVAQSYDAGYMAAYGLAWADASGKPASGTVVAEGFAHLEAGAKIAIGRSTWSTALATLTTGAATTRTIDIDGTSGPLDFDTATGNAPGPIEIWRANKTFTAFETCAACQAGKTCDLSACSP